MEMLKAGAKTSKKRQQVMPDSVNSANKKQGSKPTAKSFLSTSFQQPSNFDPNVNMANESYYANRSSAV